MSLFEQQPKASSTRSDQHKIASADSSSAAAGAADPNPEEWATMSRSARKRFSERKRRNEFKDSFDNLIKVLLHADPNFAQQMDERERQGSVRVHREEYDGDQVAFFNRIELINQTIFSLERLKDESDNLKELQERIKKGDLLARLQFKELLNLNAADSTTTATPSSFHHVSFVSNIVRAKHSIFHLCREFICLDTFLNSAYTCHSSSFRPFLIF